MAFTLYVMSTGTFSCRLFLHSRHHYVALEYLCRDSRFESSIITWIMILRTRGRTTSRNESHQEDLQTIRYVSLGDSPQPELLIVLPGFRPDPKGPFSSLQARVVVCALINGAGPTGSARFGIELYESSPCSTSDRSN